MNYDLSLLELKIISLLDTAFSISELAERTSVTKGYTSRAVASLKDKGFVETSKRGITKKVTLSAKPACFKAKNPSFPAQLYAVRRTLAGVWLADNGSLSIRKRRFYPFEG